MKRKLARLIPSATGVLLVATTVLAGQGYLARAASAAGFTTIDAVVDGGNHCLNGNLKNGVTIVNCNIYTGKQYVWLNGGPAAAALGDGTYFFAVLVPGGQPNPNDGAPKNLSDTTAAPWPAGSLNADGTAIPSGDSYTNRTFTVSSGKISYTGTHTFDAANNLIRLMPYDDTTNPGGVYIMAICSLAGGYPVTPSDCKYDAFKVKAETPAKVTAMFSGEKYLDSDGNGVLDNGESGLSGWTISITCVGCGHGGKDVTTTTTTDANGEWSFETDFAPSAGTTTYIIKEVLQAGWVQTGNTVNVSVPAGGATSSLSSFVYTVTIPNNAVSTVDMLDFGNVPKSPPICQLTGTFAGPPSGIKVTVQGSSGIGLKQIVVTENNNGSVDIPPFASGITGAPVTVQTGGTTSPVVVTATKINQSLSSQLALAVTDVGGNVTTCDPVDISVSRATGRPTTYNVTVTGPKEGLVHIANGVPGVTNLTIRVNRRSFHLNGLRPGQHRQLDIRSALAAGRNKVFLTASGRKGGTIAVVIADS